MLPNVIDKKVGSQEGIVMVVYPKLIASAFATIRTLRDVLGCRLPIEIWYRQDEINKIPGSLRPLKQLAQNDTAGEIIFREINDSQAVRFGAKVFAIYNSGFDCLLFLDADNVPLDMPFHMIQTPPAVAGTVTGESFCGMTMVQHDAQGEVLFLHRNAKKLTGEFLYKPVNYRVEARKHVRSKLIKLGIYALPSEEAVLEELAAIEKTPPQTLEPSEPDGIADQIIWTHLLSFRKGSPRSEYKVKSYRAAPDFPKTQRCYGERFLGRSKHFEAQSVAELSFSGLETHLRRFAMEAAQLRQAQ
ncbi:hypothetical protein BBO99_00007550 [Phytophthora kernoviae]|uniref:Nucleotide-diphospho-sugar transferase domain-containing protein n=2 Tax=Phytophthora kernoviae TaxID=325452 RepID=A0A3R7J130_9STRA|nr:hypothetical protein G195_008578 [Phytophthora kernoviae 00238/432]KAG2518180.1 hypothetical protein JM16_007380 [Phytophthora kernoviae]KAG2519991.1 hypothetical protein JM18_007113 [Phytophthora kernoviae]RLN05675.1 hypothetical protein BBI17_007500 [Phytophthora kernoviae]RLN76445.1 hypothetical protein BBO99_00007550 [Phytophthora kernoviae]